MSHSFHPQVGDARRHHCFLSRWMQPTPMSMSRIWIALTARIRRQWLVCRPASTPHAKSTFQPQITKWHDNRLLPAERPRTLGTHLPRSATLFYRVVAERALPINHRDARNRYGISVTDSTTSMGFLCCECAIMDMRKISPATGFHTRQGAERQRHRLLIV